MKKSIQSREISDQDQMTEKFYILYTQSAGSINSSEISTIIKTILLKFGASYMLELGSLLSSHSLVR